MSDLAESLAKALEDEAFKRDRKTSDEPIDRASLMLVHELKNAARDVRRAGELLQGSKEWRAKTATERLGSDDQA